MNTRASLYALALMAVNGSAIAVEERTLYPGASCQPLSNTLAISRDATGGMFNTGDAPQDWTCPIVRRVATDEIENAQIVVIDRNVAAGDPNVSCTLFSRTSTGGAGAAVFGVTLRTAGDTESPVTLSYGDGDKNAINGADGGYYYFRCRIPGTFLGRQSGVVSYRATENNGED